MENDYWERSQVFIRKLSCATRRMPYRVSSHGIFLNTMTDLLQVVPSQRLGKVLVPAHLVLVEGYPQLIS